MTHRAHITCKPLAKSFAFLAVLTNTAQLMSAETTREKHKQTQLPAAQGSCQVLGAQPEPVSEHSTTEPLALLETQSMEVSSLLKDAETESGKDDALSKVTHS